MKKTQNQEKKIQDILSELTKIKAELSDKQVAIILDEVKKELNCLV